MSLSKAQMRSIRDIKTIEKDNVLRENGIFVLWDENNIFKMKVLIIGPDDTPYEKGFFFFDVNIPEDYPFKPPHVRLCTLSKNVRFNPNLYSNGKVCLSILNTWSGPTWTASLTLPSVFLSIQSLMNEYPLRNEPGFENETEERCNIYNNIIQYYTFEVAIRNVLIDIPLSFESFNPIITEYFMNNYDKYMNKIIDLSVLHNKKRYKSPIYNMEVICNYKYIIEELKHFKEINLALNKSIGSQHTDNDTDINIIENTSISL